MSVKGNMLFMLKRYSLTIHWGTEIWRIENFQPVSITKSSHGKFFNGDSYVILKTAALKNGALRHDIHYWIGKDTTQDEAGTAAIKTVELDAALGGLAVQYREVQGHETEKFLSYFKLCIIPQKGGIASGFKHAEAAEHIIRLYVCKGKHVVHVKEVPFARSSPNHDDIVILDTKSKIFQFNGSNSSIQERAKALEVVHYIKESHHHGKYEVAAIENGKLMADADTGEFWGFFGGFAPLPRKTANDDDMAVDAHATKLFWTMLTLQGEEVEETYIMVKPDGVQRGLDGNKPIHVAAERGNRSAVEILFPLTSPVKTIPKWTIDGILEHMQSEFGKQQEEARNVKEANLSNDTTLSKQHTVEVTPEAKKKAAEAKSRGDDAFKRKDYQMAVDAYTQAIDFDPSDATLFSNRSLCWFRLGQAEHALADAKACRVLRPGWPKACYREGAALQLLQRFDEAANSFYDGVQLDPENMELVNAFRDAVDAGRKFHGTKQEKSLSDSVKV